MVRVENGEAGLGQTIQGLQAVIKSVGLIHQTRGTNAGLQTGQ